MNVAFVTTVLPGERGSGGELVSQAFVDALRAAGHRVTVLGYRRPGRRPPLHTDDVAAAERPIETVRAPVRAAIWLAAALALGEPYSAAKYHSRAYRTALRRILDERPPALVVLDHAGVGFAARLLPAGTRMAYLAHNVEHELYGGLAERASGPRRAVLRREAGRTLRLETTLARRADETWALSESDAAALSSLGARVTRTFAVPVRAPHGSLPRPDVDVAVLGSWSWSANAAGLEWFCDKVLPALPAAMTVAVGGAGSERVDRCRPGVSGRGRVDDALAFLRSARVVAVPSVTGAGVQIKTLDAIASGRRVVATPTAARGLAGLPDSVSVAEDASEFAGELATAVGSAGDADSSDTAAVWMAERERQFLEQVASAAREAGGAA